jgi:cold shock CspA family protein
MTSTAAAEKKTAPLRLDSFSLYAEIAENGPHALEASCLVQQRGWFDRLASFDPRSGLPLVRGLSDICEAILEHPPGIEGGPCDLFARIVEHVRDALVQLVVQPRSRIVRDHQMVPIGSACELDSTCIDWLSRQIGGTLREKLAGRNSLLAVKRKHSLDTAENRLLVTVSRQLCERLEARFQVWGSGDEALQALHDDLQRWIETAEVQAIGVWGHVPPNNTLLQDRLYRPVWDAWRRLQSLDDDIAADLANLGSHWMTILQWELVARLHAQGVVRFAQQPCRFDYYAFGLSTLSGRLEGLHVPALCVGRVKTTGKDRNDQAMGFLRTEDGRDLFFHSSDFVRAEEFAQVKPGTRLVYEIKASPKGVKAVRLSLEPQPWTLGLTFETSTCLRLDAGPRSWRLSLLAQGGQGQLSFQGNEIQLDLTPREATVAAERIISSLFPRVPATPVKHRDPGSSQFTFLDLSEVCPQILDEQGTRNLSEPLVVQFWQEDGERVALDSGPMRALALGADTSTVSLLDLMGNDSGALLHRSAAQQLAARLCQQLGPTRLTYLVHDAVDDFASEALRSALNARFERPEPLPRSVALLFAWLSGGGAAQALRAGDAVLALDCAGDTVSLTPLIAVQGETGRRLVWERHPPVLVGHEGSQVQRVVNGLQALGITQATSLAQLFGSTALDPARSWQLADGNWFTPTSATHAENGWSPGFQRNLQVAINALPEKARWGKKNTHLVIGAVFEPVQQVLKGQWNKVFSHYTSLLEGAKALADLQLQAPEFVLWRDYLPELSIRVVESGYLQRLYLVRGQAITPQRGVPIPIPVLEGFTLRAGEVQYRFALHQGGESSRLQQEAVLSHPLLPLSVDVRVKLTMTFTYGNDYPYELDFIPIDEDREKAGFERIRARWQPTRPDEVGGIPDVPPARDWAHWMSSDGPGGMSVVQKLLGALDRLLAAKPATGPDIKQLSRHGRDARFFASKIWAQGRSLQEPTCDDALRVALIQRLPALHECLLAWQGCADSGHETQRLCREVLSVVCTLQGDLPDFLSGEIVRQFDLDWGKGGARKMGKAFAHAMGDAHLPWQRYLLETWRAELPSAEDDPKRRTELIEIFRVALWYSPMLLELLVVEDLESLLDLLHSSMLGLSRRIALAGTSASDSLVSAVTRDSELLLALLWTRRHAELRVSGLLAPGAERCRRFAFLIDELTMLIAGSASVMKSRITLDTQKPDNLNKTPDLLYSLGLYLTGDSGAGSICVTEVSDEEN